MKLERRNWNSRQRETLRYCWLDKRQTNCHTQQPPVIYILHDYNSWKQIKSVRSNLPAQLLAFIWSTDADNNDLLGEQPTPLRQAITTTQYGRHSHEWLAQPCGPAQPAGHQVTWSQNPMNCAVPARRSTFATTARFRFLAEFLIPTSVFSSDITRHTRR